MMGGAKKVPISSKAANLEISTITEAPVFSEPTSTGTTKFAEPTSTGASKFTEPTSTNTPRGTLQFSEKVSKQKMKRHIEGTAPREKSYFETIEDAQQVLDAYNSGNYKFISEIVGENSVTIEVPSVTGRYVNVDNPNGLPDLNLPTNKFMIESSKSPKVVPVNPNK